MALICLLPGETFSHTHEVVSTSTAVAGEVELTVAGETFALTPTTVVIPAGEVHVLRNVGNTIAQVACGGYGAVEELDDAAP